MFYVVRAGSQMKILAFDRTGYAIWAKRLERGRFVIAPDADDIKRSLTHTELQCLLDGIEVRDAPHYKRSCLPERQGGLV